MGVTSEYFKLQKEYEEKYGERTIVMMQIGSFYEMYEYDPSSCDEKHKKREAIGHAVDLSSILNMILTSKDKSRDHSMDNPYMIGFPCAAYDRHKEVILSHNYTIVRIDQVDTKKGNQKMVERKVVEILSPATTIDNITNIPLTNQLMSIYIECQKAQGKCENYLITCGISTIDVSTGKSMVLEVYSKEKDNAYAIYEVYRCLVSQQPREIIVNINNIPEGRSAEYIKYLQETLELDKYANVFIKCNQINKEYLKIDYHEQFLTKLFYGTSKSSPMRIKSTNLKVIEELDLERFYYGCISYIVLLQYCYEHNELIIKKIQKPDTNWIDTDKHLILTYNAINQINILPLTTNKLNTNGRNVKTYDSLLTVVNNTSTSLGKRFLTGMLLNPITDVEQLESYYNLTDELLLEQNRELLEAIETQLKKIPDIERYQRKLSLQVIKPHEFVILIRAYINIVELFKLLNDSDTTYFRQLLFDEPYRSEFNNCLTQVLTTIDLDKLEKCKLLDNHLEFDDSFFYTGVDPIADNYQQRICHNENCLSAICDHLNIFLSNTRGKKIEFNRSHSSRSSPDDTPTNAISTTNHKASVIKSQKSRIDSKLCGDIELKPEKSTTIITSKVIEKCFSELEENITQLEKYLYQQYNQLISNIVESYKFFPVLTQFISLVDFIKSNTKTALKYNYFRPVIDHSATHSFLHIKDLRHPIIEHIIDSEYITNDISLGLGPKGILLYGLNSCGKCLDPETDIILYSGSIIKAKEVTVGSLLMGDDNTPRKVLSTIEGYDQMYKIEPTNGKPFICTGDHVLVVKDNHKIIELTVNDYLKNPQSYQLYTMPIDFEETAVDISPYSFGYCLEDSIPNDYKYNSRRVRLSLLAGIIDYYNSLDITIDNETLIDDIIFLANSLGLDTFKSNPLKLSISGPDLIHLPLLNYKIPIDRLVSLNRTFTVQPLGLGKFNGFELDGNHRFLLGDFTVSHNSSLAKSIGLNIILAQAGLFTSGKLTYYPYSSIITRLSGNDDIFKGHSSFVVEMTELRTILRNADKNTLVLGDELTRGTENISGTSLTIATILTLLERECSFIFSTHLHNIPDTSYIRDIDTSKLRICHLSTSYDEQTQNLIYDRKLKDGPGNSLYGIEVAKYIGLDPSFIELANEIRKNVSGVSPNILNTKKSRYNSKLYVDSCLLCGTKDNLHTHHINEQNLADVNGFIGHFHKNSIHNLVVLCNKCHTNIHKNNMKVDVKQSLVGNLVTVNN